MTVKTAKGRALRTLAPTLLAGDRSVMTGGVVKSKLGSVTTSKFVCPASGRCYLVVASDSGDATQLLATLSLAPPKSGKGSIAAFAPTQTTTLHIGAMAGASLSLKFAGDKKHALVATVVSVTDPSGTAVPFTVKSSKTGGSMTLALPSAGTWTVVLSAKPGMASPGKFTYSYAIKQPKHGTYIAE